MALEPGPLVSSYSKTGSGPHGMTAPPQKRRIPGLPVMLNSPHPLARHVTAPGKCRHQHRQNLWPDGISLRLPPTGGDSTAETSKILVVNADGGRVSPPGSNHCVSPGWLLRCVLAAPLTVQCSFTGCTKPSLPGFSLLTALCQSPPFVGLTRHLWRTWWEGRKGT